MKSPATHKACHYLLEQVIGGVMQIRSGQQILSRSQGCLQIGIEAEHGILIDGLSKDEEKCLRLLESPIARQDFFLESQRLGVSIERATAFLQQLRDYQILETGLASDSAIPSHGGHSLNASAASSTTKTSDGWVATGARSKASIAVLGLGPLGIQLAAILAGAGIGTLILKDVSNIGVGDIASGAFQPEELGKPRGTVAAQRCRALRPEIEILEAQDQLPDMLIAVEHGVADPLTFHHLMDARVTHLSVVVRERSAAIGPLVRPGRSTCTRCLDHYRLDQDPYWPRIAAQVAGSSWAMGSEEDPVLASIGSGVAAAQALTEIDGGNPTSVGGQLVIRLPEGIPIACQRSPHPRCSCGRGDRD